MIVRNRAHDILMRGRNVPLEEQFNEINSIQAQFWLAYAERYQQVYAALATLPAGSNNIASIRRARFPASTAVSDHGYSSPVVAPLCRGIDTATKRCGGRPFSAIGVVARMI